jgi:hypothetical protein
MFNRFFLFIEDSTNRTASLIKKVMISANIITIYNGVSQTSVNQGIDMERVIPFPEFDFLNNVTQATGKCSGNPYKLISHRDFEHRYLPPHVTEINDVKHWHLVACETIKPNDVANLLLEILQAPKFHPEFSVCLQTSKYAEYCEYYFAKGFDHKNGLASFSLKERELISRAYADELLTAYKSFYVSNSKVMEDELVKRSSLVSRDEELYMQRVETAKNLYMATVGSIFMSAGLTVLRRKVLKIRLSEENTNHALDGLMLLMAALTTKDITPVLFTYATKVALDLLTPLKSIPYLNQAASIGLGMMGSDSLFSLYGVFKYALTTSASIGSSWFANNMLDDYESRQKRPFIN